MPLYSIAPTLFHRGWKTPPQTRSSSMEGLERLFGSYHQIAAQIYDQTILVGLQPHVAVASNPDAAIHAARGFEGILVVPRGMERERFAELPLSVLSSNSDFLETLHRWGIRTFGTFAKLPRTKVAERLGQEGAHLHKLSRGELSRPLNPYKESLRFEETMELDHAIVLLEPLTFVLSRLLDQICRRLRVRNRSTHEIRVTLDLDERGATAHERVLRLPLPICDPRLLVKLLMLDLESHPPKAGVVCARVEAIPTRPRTVQNGLFVPLAPEAEKLELTLARIAHVVGQENVGYPVLLDTNRPDAFRVERFQSALIERAYSAGGAVYDHPIAFRQFRPALEATVQLRAGAPSWIAFRGLFGAITTVSGPWNSSGDWWREDRWDREEWDIGIESRTNSLAMYRIYRDCASNRWFVDGVYD